MKKEFYPIDLHTHSNWADGSCTPREIAERAKKKGITHIALSDCMNLGGLDEFHNACSKLGIVSIPSIELLTFYDNDEVELLLYGNGIFDNQMKALIGESNHAAEILVLMYIGFLRSKGFSVSEKDIDAYFNLPKKRTKCLYYVNEYLRRKNNIPQNSIGSLIREAKLRHIDRADIYQATLPRVQGVLRTAKKLNIISCYTYPGVAALRRSRFRNTDYKTELGLILQESLLLKSMGLDGIEARYPDHTADTEHILLEHAQNNDLLIIGGSGFHGDGEGEHKPGLSLGCKGMNQAEYDVFTKSYINYACLHY